MMDTWSSFQVEVSNASFKNLKMYFHSQWLVKKLKIVYIYELLTLIFTASRLNSRKKNNQHVKLQTPQSIFAPSGGQRAEWFTSGELLNQFHKSHHAANPNSANRLLEDLLPTQTSSNHFRKRLREKSQWKQKLHRLQTRLDHCWTKNDICAVMVYILLSLLTQITQLLKFFFKRCELNLSRLSNCGLALRDTWRGFRMCHALFGSFISVCAFSGKILHFIHDILV